MIFTDGFQKKIWEQRKKKCFLEKEKDCENEIYWKKITFI